MLFLDGVYVEGPDGSLRFHWVRVPTGAELAGFIQTGCGISGESFAANLDFDLATGINFASLADDNRMPSPMGAPTIGDAFVKDEQGFVDRDATVVPLVDEAYTSPPATAD